MTSPSDFRSFGNAQIHELYITVYSSKTSGWVAALDQGFEAHQNATMVIMSTDLAVHGELLLAQPEGTAYRESFRERVIETQRVLATLPTYSL